MSRVLSDARKPPDDSVMWEYLWKLIDDGLTSDPYKEVKVALDRGVNPNAADPVTGNQALHLFAATYKSPVKSLELLLSRGANVHAGNKDENTPLAMAIFYDNVDAAERLLKHGADPNVKYYNAVPMLFHAADFGYPQLVPHSPEPRLCRDPRLLSQHRRQTGAGNRMCQAACGVAKRRGDRCL